MSKGTSIKDALSAWEKENEQKPTEATEIVLTGVMPPIEKIDARWLLSMKFKNTKFPIKISLLTLGACEKLSLSTNAIEKIANLNGLKLRFRKNTTQYRIDYT